MCVFPHFSVQQSLYTLVKLYDHLPGNITAVAAPLSIATVLPALARLKVRDGA